MDVDALLAAPALEPPPGVTPNFDNPPNKNGLAWGVLTTCVVIATLCLLLRLYARLWLQKKIRIEEAFTICAYGAFWGTSYAAYALIYSPGYSVHNWDLTNGDLIHPLYLILIYGCCYSAVLPLLKSAILLDWCRIFVTASKLQSPFWLGCMFIVVIQCLWGVLCIILLNTQCTPHQAIWEFYLPSKCYSLPKVMLTSASVQVFCDIAMVLLPQKVIWGLHLNWQRKLGISIVFGVGIVACVAACFRLANTVTFFQKVDTMYNIGPLLFWAHAEMACGFFIISVPCLPKIVSESGLSIKLKRVLGITRKSTTPVASGSYGRGTASGQRPEPGMKPDAYHKVDEIEIPMSGLDKSESQEFLRVDRQ